MPDRAGTVRSLNNSDKPSDYEAKPRRSIPVGAGRQTGFDLHGPDHLGLCQTDSSGMACKRPGVRVPLAPQVIPEGAGPVKGVMCPFSPGSRAVSRHAGSGAGVKVERPAGLWLTFGDAFGCHGRSGLVCGVGRGWRGRTFAV